jgi:hypothetical protein
MDLPAKYLRVFLLLSLLLVIGGAVSVSAQRSAEDNTSSKPQLGKDEEDSFCRKTGDQVFDEMRLKLCYKQQQKEFQELLNNGEEAAKLSGELETSFEKSSALSAEDQKKLDRLEKLTKKIRNSLGGENDEDDDASADKPLSLKDAFVTLNEKASNLVSDLKKTTRYSISVVSIQGSNAVLRLVRYIRFGKK